jgi:hypothetical protein
VLRSGAYALISSEPLWAQLHSGWTTSRAVIARVDPAGMLHSENAFDPATSG